ncbi:MAG: transketolase C-terminal domain-containing protein [Thermoleophilia bacterium]
MSADATGPRVLKGWQAVNAALHEELERDERVVVLGEDVARAGGTYGETRRLLDRFGPGRVRDTPISEQAIVGAAVGMALVGLRPVAEILFVDFLGLASDQLVNQAAKLPAFAPGLSVPLVVKSAVGTELGLGAQHSQALEGWYAQVPGLAVAWPSTPRDLHGLLKAAIRADGPVLFLESLALLRETGPVGGPDDVVELGVADVCRPGRDLTLVTWGTMRGRSLAAAGALAEEGIEVEVIDLRTIVPWDREAVFASVERTHRCLVVTEAVREFGPGGEIAAEVGEACFDALDAPVARLGSPRVVAPHTVALDRLRVPQADAIADRARELCR